MELTPVETRVLGCLLEKERTTPDAYPLTLNSLLLACNQSTNARAGADAQRARDRGGARRPAPARKLATVIFGGGSRVQKYRHILPDTYNFSPQEYALLCVLLLRGPQTLGELRGRTERLASFPQLSDVEGTLAGLAEGGGTTRPAPRRSVPGQKERRYAQLLSGEPTEPTPEELAACRSRANARLTRRGKHPTTRPAWNRLEQEVAELRRTTGYACAKAWMNCAARSVCRAYRTGCRVSAVTLESASVFPRLPLRAPAHGNRAGCPTTC